MAGTTLDYLSLKNVRLTWNLGNGSQVVADATEVRIPRTLAFADRTPGMSGVKRKVRMEDDLVVTVVGWNSSNLAVGQIVPGSRLTAFTLLSTAGGTPSVLQDDFFTKFPVNKMMLGNTDTTLGAEPSKWTTEIQTNVDG